MGFFGCCEGAMGRCSLDVLQEAAGEMGLFIHDQEHMTRAEVCKAAGIAAAYYISLECLSCLSYRQCNYAFARF